LRRKEIKWDMKYLKILGFRYQKIVMLSILMVFTSGFVAAQQFSSQFWHKGFIITAKNDTVRGEIKYDMEANSLQVKGKQKVYSFSSHNVLLCEIYDLSIENTRRFYSMPYEIRRDYKTRVLFELLYEGPLSLLTREEIVQETVPTASVYGGSVVRSRLKFYYFFLDNKGKIQYYTGKKADLLSIMGRKSGQVKSFIKQNKLKTDEVRDLIRIVAFYNSI